AVLEQPLRPAREVARQLPQDAARDEALDLAPGEEEQRPGGVCGRGGGEVRDQRRHLGVGRGRAVQGLVELGEGAHYPMSASPWKRVASAAASTPLSPR